MKNLSPEPWPGGGGGAAAAAPPLRAEGVALDCGAGIGRVAGAVLLERFAAVELLEPNADFVAAARGALPAARLAACHTVALQAFAPPAGRAYAVVWVQWTLNYLTDDDVAAFLRRAAAALEPGGAVVVKESVAREGRGFYADAGEASITRTDAHFREIFERAGLAVVAAAPQPELPQAVFPVTMWALRAR